MATATKANAARDLKDKLQSMTSLALAAGIMNDRDPQLAQLCMDRANKIQDEILKSK